MTLRSHNNWYLVLRTNSQGHNLQFEVTIVPWMKVAESTKSHQNLLFLYKRGSVNGQIYATKSIDYYGIVCRLAESFAK